MPKRGASQAGSGKTNSKAKDQARAAHLPPAPKSWNPSPTEFPYHRNTNARNRRNRAG